MKEMIICLLRQICEVDALHLGRIQHSGRDVERQNSTRVV